MIAKFITRSSSPPVLLAGHADFRVVSDRELPSIFSVGSKSPMRSMSAKSFIAKWDAMLADYVRLDLVAKLCQLLGSGVLYPSCECNLLKAQKATEELALPKSFILSIMNAVGTR